MSLKLFINILQYCKHICKSLKLFINLYISQYYMHIWKSLKLFINISQYYSHICKSPKLLINIYHNTTGIYGGH